MSTATPKNYHGREQAWVKHNLLKSYLQKLVLIIGASAKQVGQVRKVQICYVDCFAGPWSVDDSDQLKGTSIAISLDTLATCKDALAKLGIEATMRALYIEKDASAFARLESFLGRPAAPTIETKALQGDFVDLRSSILDWCGQRAFTFFFVDPKGWKDVGVETLRPLLQRPRSEFLINFAYNFINRTASMADWQDAMVKLLGAPIDLTGMSPPQREEALVDAYRIGLKKHVSSGGGVFVPRTAYVRVLDPTKERTKYHLVYLTSHPKGIVEFMDISASVDVIQKRVRASKKSEARELESGIADMFGSDSLVDPADGHGEPREVDNFWLRYLAQGTRRVDTAAFAEILEATNWFPQDLQWALVRLIKLNKVRNLDANAAKRPLHPLHFNKAERLELVLS